MKNHGTKISNGIGVGEMGFSTASLARLKVLHL